jgi:hypothetical protein
MSSTAEYGDVFGLAGVRGAKRENRLALSLFKAYHNIIETTLVQSQNRSAENGKRRIPTQTPQVATRACRGRGGSTSTKG